MTLYNIHLKKSETRLRCACAMMLPSNNGARCNFAEIEVDLQFHVVADYTVDVAVVVSDTILVCAFQHIFWFR